MSDTPSLATDRLRLRERRPDDAGALFASLSDPELMRWWSRPPYESVEELHDHFAQAHDGWRCWTVTLPDDDRAIGFVAAGEKRQGKVTEIGYMLARDHWGTGMAREAVAAVITHLFAEGQRRIFADTDPENTPSNALLDRLGFRREGLLRGEWETHIGVRDSVIWGLLADEWKG